MNVENLKIGSIYELIIKNQEYYTCYVNKYIYRKVYHLLVIESNRPTIQGFDEDDRIFLYLGMMKNNTRSSEDMRLFSLKTSKEYLISSLHTSKDDKLYSIYFLDKDIKEIA